MPKVTIILPVYNSEKYLERCIESIVNQSFNNIELLIINDGSTDGSETIIKNFASKYKFIRYISKKNTGVADTRNQGILRAHGEYIMFIDNDDYIDKDYVAIHYEAIVENGSDVVLSGYRRIDDDKILFEKQLSNNYWSRYIIVAPWAKIYKKEYLIKNKVVFLDYLIGEDVYFNSYLYSKKPKIQCINYIGYNWYFNSNSVSNSKQTVFSDKIDITYLLNKILTNCTVDEYLFYYIRRYIVWYLLFAGRHSHYKLFIQEFTKCNKWMTNNSINCNINAFSIKLKGESFRDRLAVAGISVISKLHLINLFARIYCNGKN